MKSLGAIAAVVGCAALTACSSTTNGAGERAGRPTAPSTHDFPSITAPATSPAPITSEAPASPPAASIHPAPSSPLKTVTTHAPDGASYVVKIWQQVEDPTCFDHAYGTPMITYLTQHPCTGLRRTLATTTVGGREVGFNESEAGFPAGPPANPYRWAEKFKTLEEADNTGSIVDLLRDGYRLPSGPTALPASEVFNVLGQDSGVVVYDVWYLDGSTPSNDPALIKMTQDIFLQF